MFLFACFAISAQDLSSDQSKKLEKKVEWLKTLAASSQIVEAVKSENAKPNPDYVKMDNSTWSSLTVLDAKVKYFSSNPVAEFLKSKKDDSVSEMFLNAKNGNKMAFLSKPTYFTHIGKSKHDEPMKNKVWTGKVEMDESTGSLNIQVAVPVLDEKSKEAIGVLTVGFAVSKL